MSAGSQLFRRVVPILFWGPFRAPSGVPKLIRQGCDVRMSERGDTVSHGRLLGMFVSQSGVFHRLPRMFVRRQVILASLLLGQPMGMRGHVVKFGGTPVVLVM